MADVFEDEPDDLWTLPDEAFCLHTFDSAGEKGQPSKKDDPGGLEDAMDLLLAASRP